MYAIAGHSVTKGSKKEDQQLSVDRARCGEELSQAEIRHLRRTSGAGWIWFLQSQRQEKRQCEKE